MGKVLEFKPKNSDILDEAEKMVEAIDRFHCASLELSRELVERGKRGEQLTQAENKFLAESAHYSIVIHGLGGRIWT